MKTPTYYQTPKLYTDEFEVETGSKPSGFGTWSFAWTGKMSPAFQVQGGFKTAADAARKAARNDGAACLILVSRR